MMMKSYKSYVLFLTDLMVIDMPNVYFKKDGQFYDIDKRSCDSFELKPTAKSTTVPKENEIYIDLDKIDEQVEIYLILAHEIRHCAQWQCVNDVGLADITTDKIRKEWIENFKDYSGSEVNNYESQSVELDANAFTVFIGQAALGINAYPKNVDKAIFEQYLKAIMSCFSIDEVHECMKYAGFEFKLNKELN